MITHLNENLFKTFSQQTRIFGIWLLILGSIGILFPIFMSFIADILMASVLLFAGIGLGFFLFQTHSKAWLEWFKTFILIVMAAIMFIYPAIGIQSLGLLFSLYFLIDASIMFTLTFRFYPNQKWFLWLINALLSLFLGIVFLMAYPFDAPYLVGLFIGISLFFNGLALILTSSAFNKMEE